MGRLMTKRASILRVLSWMLLLLVFIAAANLLSIRWYGARGYALDVGARFDPELQFLDGFFQPERDENNTTYRWSQAQSTFSLRGFVPAPDPILSLVIGGVPASAQIPLLVEVEVDGLPAMTLPVRVEKRTYAVQLPSTALADGDLTVRFRNPAVQSGTDDRPVGFRLDNLSIGWAPDRWLVPLWTALLAQWATVCIWLCVLWRLGLRPVFLAPLAVGLIVLLAWMAGQHQLVAMAWTMRMVGTGGLVLVLAWNALLWMERWEPHWSRSAHILSWVCILTAASIAIRLFAVYYPWWESHDLYIHRDRFSILQSGSLHLYDKPSEFGGRRTIVPPAYYLLANPIMLVAAHPGVPLQGLYAFFDGLNPLLAALFVARLGGRPRAALIAAIMIAVLPIQFTALWWGFGPQVAGQTLVLVLALLMLREGMTRRTLIMGVFVLSLIFLMHPGVAVLTAFWMALYVVLVWWFHRAQRHWWLGWSIVVVLTGIIVTVALYMDVIALQASGVSQGSATRPDFTEWDRIRLTLEGMGASLRPIGVLLMLLGVVALLRILGRPQRWLVVAWLGSATLFFVVDLATGLQVRYAYFAIAPLCAGLGVLLDGVMQRGRVGKVVAWSFVSFVALFGLALWFNGVFFDVKPTLTALLH